MIFEDITTSVQQKIEVMLARCKSIRLLYPNGSTVACMAAMLASAGGEVDALPSRLFDLVTEIKKEIIKTRAAFGTPMQCQAAATLMVYPQQPTMLPTDLTAQYVMPAVWPKVLTSYIHTSRAAPHMG